MKTIITILLFGLTLQSIGQNDSNAYMRLKRQINKNLQLCNAYDSRQYELLGDLDIDSISNRAALDITKLLCLEESRNLNLNEFTGIDLSASTNDQTRIRIYSFSYSSGGTMGDVVHNVMQWTNRDGKLFSYYLPWSEYGNFNQKITTLRSDSIMSLYLLTGSAKENTTHVGYWATVFKFSGDYFYTNYQAFGNRNELWLTNVSMSVDTATLVLHLSPDFAELDGYMLSRLNHDNSDPRSPYRNDTSGNRRYYNLIMGKYNADPDYPTDHGINLKWNGTRFVNIGPALKPD